jgi:hypothetical protein
VRLAINYRRPARWWLIAVCAGISVAMALAVLVISDAAPASVLITGGGAGAGAARSYDLVVRGQNPAAAGGPGGADVSQADLTALSAGITLAQYATIRRLPGVRVAAPMTMVGYVPLTVSVPVEVPASAIPGAPRPVTLTVRLRSDNGLSTVIWDDVVTAYPAGQRGRAAAMVSVPVSWTFQLPLVAVDPVAEARLLHLDSAVTGGSYLPAAGGARSGQVPVLIAGSIADGEVADVSLDPESGGAVGGTPTLTAAHAYSVLVDDARETAGTVRTYWTATPVAYGKAADGGLVPRPVAVDLAAVWGGPYEWAGMPADASVLDVPFRSLTEHGAVGAGVAVRAVGVFDPARISTAPATPSPYLPELLTGADERSRRLLGGQPLAADGDPGGYPGAAASLVMPLADIGALAGAFAGGYAGEDSGAPIGVIRVRVAGAAGDDAASRERIRVVAQEIVRATGLRVFAVLDATTTTKVIDLPAGLHGRPPLRVDEVWYRSAARTTVSAGPDRHSISLSELELLAGQAAIAWGVWRLTAARRRELATLRALGWRRRQVGEHLVAEFALTAMVAVVAAVLAVYAAGSLLVGRPGWTWLLLSVPAAVAMILAAAWWPLLRTTASLLARRINAGRPWRRGRPFGAWAAVAPGPALRLLRTPSRTLLGAFVIALACAALSLELAARWAYSGAAQSWAGRSVSVTGTVVDVAAVVLIVTMATATVADLDLVTRTERAAELRTLRAIGWSARDVTRLTVWNAVRLGLAGGLAAGALDLLGGLAAAGAVPPRLIAVAAFAAAAGVAMSLLAAGVSAAMCSKSSADSDRVLAR